MTARHMVAAIGGAIAVLREQRWYLAVLFGLLLLAAIGEAVWRAGPLPLLATETDAEESLYRILTPFSVAIFLFALVPRVGPTLLVVGAAFWLTIGWLPLLRFGVFQVEVLLDYGLKPGIAIHRSACATIAGMSLLLLARGLNRIEVLRLNAIVALALLPIAIEDRQFPWLDGVDGDDFSRASYRGSEGTSCPWGCYSTSIVPVPLPERPVPGALPAEIPHAGEGLR